MIVRESLSTWTIDILFRIFLVKPAKYRRENRWVPKTAKHPFGPLGCSLFHRFIRPPLGNLSSCLNLDGRKYKYRSGHKYIREFKSYDNSFAFNNNQYLDE